MKRTTKFVGDLAVVSPSSAPITTVRIVKGILMMMPPELVPQM